ncbi:GNAT family N-acetyltransferase [Yersinia aleksiciae]|uniref:Acetyltransferase (GNAT) family protein n=1 Tax=Yersinia aleksiciae TaxID=263819 RepID=A0A0T9TIN6_YERAE|nr:GNAT family N-acetyltransferase [Yersinia aleksiciae]AKP34515.1 GNAT family acetyltransferase [Yersinia aleksiciae]CFQ44220.1 acetyltransferase (GNAT) family protein [Yersinia aleksiciae]CNK85493.1 acetyltransferase (GNAT) family protein [Yersinia aleksiciae]
MVTLRAMRAEELGDYRNLFITEYAQDLVSNSDYSVEQAQAYATQSFDSYLPEGVNSPSDHLFCIENRDDIGGEEQLVGYLWYGLGKEDSAAFIKDFYVLPQCQRQGYGSACLEALEKRLIDQGIFEIKLRVAADNPQAKRLYEQMAFVVTGFNMSKSLK